MSYCQRWNNLVGTTAIDKKYAIARIPCGQWQCAVCSKRLQAKWRVHLSKAIGRMSDRKWYLLTLTASSKAHAEKSTLDNMQRGVDLILKTIRRWWHGFEYARVFEPRENGEGFHCHMICSGLPDRVLFEKSGNGNDRVWRGLPFALKEKSKRRDWIMRSYLKRVAVRAHIGYILDLKPLDDASKAVWYITKYMTKHFQIFFKKGLRHVAVSSGVGSPKKIKSDKAWQLIARLYEDDLNKQAYHGRAVYDMNEKRTVTHADFPEPLARYPQKSVIDINDNP